jgi:NAD(P)-dependent dehydrogenase (short-subunit alcohol dehydrogenase family)
MQELKFDGAAAAVTGAASGIGRALALEFAARGSDVAIADMQEDELAKLAGEIQSTYGRRTLVRRVDVSDAAQVEEFARAAIETFPQLNVAVNNAGIALLGNFDEITQDQIRRVMDVNFWGVVHGTRAFLPHLKLQPVGHIVNISSIFGIIAPPGQIAYCASKFAVRGFSEALRHELKSSGSNARISVVHPGGIKTNIARSALHGANLKTAANPVEIGKGFEQIARTTPQSAALRILRGIERNERRILIGSDAKLLDFVQRLLPSAYWTVFARAMRGMT